ncbi:MAG: HAD-IA family hydrolase [Hyphomicrobium sp.]
MTLVIFDCDGTIVDSQAGIVLSMEHAFCSLGMIPPSRAQTLAVVGLSLPEAFSALAPEAEYETRFDLAERYKRAFRDLNHDPAEIEVLYPDAKAVIAVLAARENVRLGIATGKSRRGVDRLFDREGWQSTFVTIQTADDHPSKPNPSMILRAMHETGAAPADTVMIGDTTYDIEMARAAGVGAIGVTWGYHHVQELEDAGAHIIVETYGALPSAIDAVLAQLKFRA